MPVFESQSGFTTPDVLVKEHVRDYNDYVQGFIEQHDIANPSEYITPVVLDTSSSDHIHLRIGFAALSTPATSEQKRVNIALANKPLQFHNNKLDYHYQHPHMRIKPTDLPTYSLHMGIEAIDCIWKHAGRIIVELTQQKMFRTLTLTDVLAADLYQNTGLVEVR